MPHCYHVWDQEELNDNSPSSHSSHLHSTSSTKYGVLDPSQSISQLELEVNTSIIIMSDLDALGYFVRLDNINLEQAKPCLAWLAQFHSSTVPQCQYQGHTSY